MAKFADRVLNNGRVYSVNGADEIMRGTAVAIADEKIVYVGDEAGVKEYIGADTEIIDCQGGTIMPGFIDAHCHPALTASVLENCSLYEVFADENNTSEEAAQMYVDCLKAFMDENPDKTMYRGTGWNRAFFTNACKNPKWPTRHDLDAICPDKPMVLESYCQHAMWVNTKAIEQSGLSAATPDPENGGFTREADGYPEGVFMEMEGMSLIKQNLPNFDYSVEEYKNTLLAFQDNIALPHGIIGANDCMTTENAITAMKELAQEGKLKMRLRGVYHYTNCKDLNYIDEVSKRKGSDNVSDMFQINTIKVFLDGEPAMLEPYEEAAAKERGLPADYKGQLFYTDDEIKAAYKAAAATGLQIHTHAMGDWGVRQTIEAVAYAQEETGTKSRNIIAHLMAVNDEDYAKIAEHDIIANVQPRWMSYDVDIEGNSIPMYGKERALKLYPNGKFLKEGCKVAYGTDFPIVPINPYYGLEYAMTRVMSRDDEHYDPQFDGRVLGPEEDLTESCVSLKDAVKNYTYMGAYQNFMEDYTGSIEIGKFADVIVLDKNLESIDVKDIHSIMPIMTLFKGEIVYKK